MKKSLKVILFLIVVFFMVFFTFIYNTFVNDKDDISHANAKKPLVFDTAYNSSEATHPSVLSFENKINGYKYWMAMTPYVKCNSDIENPHIFASNNLVDWQVPRGLKNPIDVPNEKPNKKQYNSDTHLIYNFKKQFFELFWRYVDRKGGTVIIYHSISKDGVKWSNKKNIYMKKFDEDAVLSPAIVLEDNIYKMWYAGLDGSVNFTTTHDFKKWSTLKKIDFNYNSKKLKTWHLDVKKINGKYEALLVVYSSNRKMPTFGDRKHLYLYYSYSNDNQKWSQPKEIIKPSFKRGAFDGKRIYRSSMLKIKDEYIVYYGGYDFDKTTGIGVSHGKDITKLKGMDSGDEIKKLS